MVIGLSTNATLAAGCFEEIVHDSRVLLRLADGRKAHLSAVIIDSRTIQSTPSSLDTGTGYDGAKRKKGAKVDMAVDALGHFLALHVTPADEQDRSQLEKLVQAVRKKLILQSKSPLLIKAILVTLPPMKLANMA